MTSTKFHYVYRITNIVAQKHYYGKRNCSIEPKLDLGIKYFSSSKDKLFIVEQKTNPQNFKYKIIRLFNTVEEATAFEIRLHNKFDVGINPSFYNRSKQTSTKFSFDGTGTVTVKDINGNASRVSVNDPRYSSGEFVPFWVGKNHSNETKEKMKAAHSSNNHQQGSNNSQYGTCWVYRVDYQKPTNIKIHKELLSDYLNQGWLKGRRF